MYHVNDLKSFVTTVEVNGIIAAAKQLNVSVATVSHRIAKLESVTGSALFYRGNKGVSLTPEGHAFYEKLVPILDAMDALNESVSPALGQLTGKLRVTLPPWILNRFILPNLHCFKAQHPKLQFEFIATDNQRDISDEGIDVAIRVGQLPDSQLLARKVIDDERILCAAATYLKKHATPKSLEDLQTHQIVCLPWLRRWSFLGENKSRAQFMPSTPILVSDAESLNVALKSGLGIGMRSRLAIEQDLQRGELVQVLPQQLIHNQAPIWFIRPNSRLASPKTERFFEFCQQVIKPTGSLN